jgi:hypothetical protein
MYCAKGLKEAKIISILKDFEVILPFMLALWTPVVIAPSKQNTALGEMDLFPSADAVLRAHFLCRV